MYYEARRLSERYSEAGGEPGFLYPGDWPQSDEEVKERVPEDWLEPTERELRRDKRKRLPQQVTVGLDGREAPTGRALHYLEAPFEFCPCCGVAYGARQASDFGKLATLGSEGRSTATTVLSLATVLHLRDAELPPQARKLLSFTDNRQDASLQAGHFNDFVQTGLLRSAVYRAVEGAGPEGLCHDQLTQKVFEALGLSLAEYASNPEVKFSARQNTDRALRDVLGYRIYRDLLRGWRITAPNLEQVDLLRIGYESLGDLCRAEEEWQGTHPALASATPEVRERVARVLLDYLRRELAIKVDYLNPDFQERMRQASNSWLVAPWALEENEKLDYARVAYARPRRPGDSREAVYVSPRGSFGQYLRRSNTFPGLGHALKTADCVAIIEHLLRTLSVAGLVEPVDTEDNGYQVVAASFVWRPGDGTQPGGDPLRVRLRENAEREANRFATYDGQDTRDLTPAEHASPEALPLPRYWVPAQEVEARLVQRDRDGNVVWAWRQNWFLGHRKTARNTDVRTIITAVMPRFEVGDKAPLLLSTESAEKIAALKSGASRDTRRPPPGPGQDVLRSCHVPVQVRPAPRAGVRPHPQWASLPVAAHQTILARVFGVYPDDPPTSYRRFVGEDGEELCPARTSRLTTPASEIERPG